MVKAFLLPPASIYDAAVTALKGGLEYHRPHSRIAGPAPDQQEETADAQQAQTGRLGNRLDDLEAVQANRMTPFRCTESLPDG